MIQVISAIRALTESVFYNHKGFGSYLAKAVIVAAFVIVGLLVGGWKMFNTLGTYLTYLIPGTWSHESLAVSVLAGIVSTVFVFVLLKHIVLLVLSPSLSRVSIDAETMQKPMLTQGIGAISRSLKITCFSILKELAFTSILFLASFLPVVGVFAAVLIFIVQAYYAGCGVSDYYLERYQNYEETVVTFRAHRWALITIGSVFLLLFFIPFIGVMLAPYLTTIAATKYFERQL
jgi:CysZ protein